MLRGLACGCLVMALAGCQAQNPYAAFGPHRVPPPGMQTPAPYYPAGGAAPPAAGPAAAAGAKSGRVSVSVSQPASASTAAVSADDVAAQPPIRIVENPAPAAAPRTSNTAPPAVPASAAPSGAGKSSQIDRADSRLAPAAYESAATAGQWKAR